MTDSSSREGSTTDLIDLAEENSGLSQNGEESQSGSESRRRSNAMERAGRLSRILVGKYQMFSQRGFRSALLSKVWTFSVLTGSCALVPAPASFLLNFLCPSNAFSSFHDFLKLSKVRVISITGFRFGVCQLN